MTYEIKRITTPRKVFAAHCVIPDKTTGEKLLQLPRVYSAISGNNSATVSSFRSFVKRDNQWYLDLPYYCYGGKHHYRAMSDKMNRKLNMICFCDKIVRVIRATKYAILHICYSVARFPRNLVYRAKNYIEYRRSPFYKMVEK